VNKKIQTISMTALVLLIVGAIDSVRNLPGTALFGSSMIFFIIFAALVFLVPCALVSAELSSAWTKNGGVYGWIKKAFGKECAFISIWLQWINTLIWFPTILSFIAGTLAYLISPNLAHNKAYLLGIILSFFWGNTLLNLKGVRVSALFASVCAFIGMVLPMALIIGLGVYWVISGHVSHVEFTASQMLPHFDSSEVWVSLTTIMASYLGIELAVVHARDVKNPQKTFPKALAISAIVIVATMMLGSLSIAIVLPHDEISLVAGVMQAFSAFFASYHWGGVLPWITFMIVLGSIGGMVNWIISPVKGLLFAAQDEQLPVALTKKNKNGVPARLLLLQAVIVSVVSMVFLLLPSVNSSYWFLTALSTELYMLMYVILFLAAIKLRYSASEQPRPFKVPGGNVGMWLTGLIGVGGCSVTLIVGFFPPEGIFDSGGALYDLMFVAGLVGMCLPPFLLLWFERFKSISTPVPTGP